MSIKLKFNCICGFNSTETVLYGSKAVMYCPDCNKKLETKTPSMGEEV